MKQPNFSQVYETFIRIDLASNPIDLLRFQIRPLINRLRDEGLINWYCFLIHNRESGVPTSADDKNAYFHLRFDLKKSANPIDFLPDYCVMTRKVDRTRTESITGVDKSLLKDIQIEEAWKIIGEQSEWVMNMLSIYDKDIDIPLDQIAQFLHFFFNMVQMAIKCPKCGSIVPF